MAEKILGEVKRKYEIFREKYNLPSFKELNKDFSIERACDNETDLVLREIRKCIADKLSNYMRFVEGLLNPVNASMFIFSILKTLNSDDKKLLEEIYKKLSKIEIGMMEVDIEYSEEREVNFIKQAVEEWQSVKKDWMKILEVVKKNWDNDLKKTGEGKGYFG